MSDSNLGVIAVDQPKIKWEVTLWSKPSSFIYRMQHSPNWFFRVFTRIGFGWKWKRLYE